MGTVGKSVLIDHVVELSALSKKQAALVVESIFDEILAETLAGNKVRIPGFGTFALKHKEARTARNPATGETIDVEAKDVLAFKASKVA